MFRSSQQCLSFRFLHHNTITFLVHATCPAHCEAQHHSVFSSSLVKKQVKQSQYRPGQALRVRGVWGFQISRQLAHEGDKVSPTHRPPLPPRAYSCCSFLLETESTPGPQCGQKYYVSEKFQWHPLGIEPAPFRFVAQCLNQMRHQVPPPFPRFFLQKYQNVMTHEPYLFFALQLNACCHVKVMRI